MEFWLLPEPSTEGKDVCEGHTVVYRIVMSNPKYLFASAAMSMHTAAPRELTSIAWRFAWRLVFLAMCAPLIGTHL